MDDTLSKAIESWVKPEPYIHRVIAVESDLDSYQHVNNSVYIRWMDDCARAHSLLVGIDCDEAVEFGYGMAVRQSHVTYLAPAYQDDEILVGAWVIHNDQKLRINREFQLIRASDQQTLIRAQLDYVCINIETGRPAKMPELFRQAYAVLPGSV